MSWVMGQHRCLRWILTEFVALCSQRLLSIGGKPCFFVEKQGSIPKKSANLRFHRNHMGMMCVENVYSIQVDSNSTVFAATTSPAFNKDLSAREVEGWAMRYQRGPLGSLGPPLGHSRLGLFILFWACRFREVSKKCGSPVVTIVVMTGMTTRGPLIPGFGEKPIIFPAHFPRFLRRYDSFYMLWATYWGSGRQRDTRGA